METLQQQVDTRTVLGKKVRALRRAGITPANVYGSKVDSVAIQIDTADMEKLLSIAGRTRMITMKIPSYKRDRRVLVKNVQRNSITGRLLHVDFYQISMTEKLKVVVPIIFDGVAPASSRNDFVVLENLTSVEVECLPADIPENIHVDITGLAEAGDHILVSDLIVDEKVTLLTSSDDIIASVSLAKIAAELEEMEEEVVAEEAEVEGAAAEAEAEAEAESQEE
ncbi:MAG: 50S ribosomal protein L25 [Chloroflexi bacterium]|nr:50S ribosomal protein L25 [Chloroflexota bacterium]